LRFAAFAGGAIALCASANAQNETGKFVYMVRIAQTSKHAAGIQTGFRLNGTKGIVTALHGVVDGITFSAFNEAGDVLTGLTVSQVDIQHDVALLRSKELEERSADGLAPSASAALSPGQELHVLGHPVGINLYDKRVVVGSPATKILYQLVPPASSQAFAKRMSPAEDVTVINLDGNLVPGDSGAPVLDGAGKVIGVVDGGLLGGAAAISWAIPIAALRWREASLATVRLNELAKLEVENLFAFAGAPTIEGASIVVSKDGDGQYTSLVDAIRAAQPGARILVRPGVYSESNSSFTIDKSVQIIGAGARDTVLHLNLDIAEGANVKLENLTFRRVFTALRVYGRIEVKNCTLAGGRTVEVEGGTASIAGSEVSASGDVRDWVVSIWKDGSLTVQDTVISGGSAAGVLVAEGSFVARNCRITQNGVGVQVNSDSRATLTACDLRGNGEPSRRRRSNLQSPDNAVLIEEQVLK